MAELPIVCTLTPEDLKARVNDLLPDLVARAVEYWSLDNGLRCRFDSAPGLLSAIAQVIERERACCRFLRFELVAEADGGSILLEVTGPAGTAAFLREHFARP